jgi:hypothetical protein
MSADERNAGRFHEPRRRRELDVTLTVVILLIWTVVIPAMVLGAASLGSRRRARLFGAARGRPVRDRAA